MTDWQDISTAPDEKVSIARMSKEKKRRLRSRDFVWCLLIEAWQMTIPPPPGADDD